MNQEHSADGRDLLTGLLRDVSRSFYLTLRVLPPQIRPQISLAYLLARATDTIADSEAVPLNERLAGLQMLRQAIRAQTFSPITLPNLSGHQDNPAEHTLLERINEALSELFRMRSEDRQCIQEVLDTISEGQRLDLVRFGAATKAQPKALSSEDELHDYTYRVAGCVGEFWTRICLQHLHPKPRYPEPLLIELGIRFGKGLQLVNILRDLPRDLREGRCYLPQEELEKLGLQPGDLLLPGNEARVRPYYNELLEVAHSHLEAAWDYVLCLPRSWRRVRVGCAWPVLIGLDSLARLKTGLILDPTTRIKTPRAKVRGILLKTVLLYPFPSYWNALGQVRSR